MSQVGTGYSDYRLIAGSPGVLHTNGMPINGPEIEVIAASSDADGDFEHTVMFDLPGISILNNHYLLPIGHFPLEIVR